MTHTQYSSFQIAKMLNVSRQAVNQWIDKGYIESYRTPGGHRRVARRDLITFLNSRGIPVPPELEENGAPEARPTGLDLVLIDDDVDFLLLLEQALKEMLPHARVRKYNSGLDGLIAIGSERPQLLLLDMKMPGLDGAEVVRRLKNNELTQDLPIIVVTAYDDSPTLQAARKLSVEQVIPKSHPLMEIAKEVVRFLGESQRSAS
mgnify:CR=1 FL=1